MSLRRKVALFLLYLIWACPALGELETTLSLTAPVLTPGTSGSFTATQIVGAAASETGTLVNPYGGVLEYQLSPGSGRFASLSGTTYGIQFDTFQLFQAFLNTNFFSMLSSGTTCPSSTNYNWLQLRFVSPDAPRGAMNANWTATRVGGTLSYNPASTPVFSSTQDFDLAGPNLYSTSYTYDDSSWGACSNGRVLAQGSTGAPLQLYGQFLFGSTFGVYVGSGGDPQMAVLMPQQTLTSGIMSNLGNQVLSGLFTGFTSKSSQTQQNLFVVPNTAGTTFTLNTINNFSDPTNYTNYGTLTCTNLNTPVNGFCSGTLSIVGMSGTSNAVCLIGSTSSQDVLDCAFYMPNQPTAGGTLIATRSSTSLISVTTPNTVPNISAGNSTTITATIQNLTGSYISTMANPSSGQLTAPFSDPGAYTVSNGGTCLGTLKGYASCTVILTYAPTADGTTMENFRVAYNNQSSTVNGTAALTAAAGLSSIVVTPNTSYLAQGGTQQYTATAHYADGSTQNITNAATWSSNANSVATVSSSGLATFLTAGSFTLSAVFAGVTGSVSANVYVPPPNPSGLSAVAASYTQVNLNWTSGGGSTTAFQIAYQTGATAPANCTSGTVITSGAVGASTSYSVTGLLPGTQYSFIVCSENGSSGAFSSGITASATTTTPHSVFATAGTYLGYLGGLYFADYVCQTEATNAGLSGIWKAVMSDQSTSATSRISLTQSVYNTLPVGSGGPALVSTSSGFWAQPLSHAISYNASGGSPGSGNAWTGSTTAGALISGQNCTSWTTSSSSVTAEYGLDTGVNATDFQNGTSSCNNAYSLYCINLQTAATTPPNPTNFTWYTDGSSSIQFTWASGGGTTAAYELAYTTGATAPANCSSGTVVPASTLGLNPTSYTLSGLSASTQYSFRLCAMNSNLSAASSGSTLTLTTTASGTVTNFGTTQVVFATTGTYQGSFGGLYFGDYICQTEASNAGLSGTWKAILSSDTVNATSHVSISSGIYNNRPASSGGIQLAASSSAAFYTSPLAYALNYNGTGSTPGQTVAWTGSTAAGATNTGNTCTSWTTASSSVRGEFGNDNNVANAIASGNNPCNNAYSLYCTNQQTSSSAPPTPTSFTWYLSANNSISLSWASGGGTTAAYQLAYQAGSAPANCTSGTVVSPGTLGINPTSYTVTGLSASTTYGFTLCAVNSDQTQMSSGTSFTESTVSSSQGPVQNLSSTQVVFSTATSYQASFGGLYYADFICQNEANANNLGGVWKAIMSDDSTSAVSRITINSSVYNNRPYSSGGIQQVAANSASFWSGSLAYAMNYNGGGTSPGNANPWTGSTAAGAINTGLTCTSWTTASSGSNGEYGANNGTGNEIATGNQGCNNTHSIYCTNQQTAAAAPPAPATFTWATASPTSISLTWTSGGGTTAGYQLAYQAGSAPATCKLGTVVSPTTLGVNPVNYSVTGLSAGTTYGFTLCAVNSDQSQLSPTISFTQATQPSGSGTLTNLGSTQVVFETTETFEGNFGGLYFADYICQNDAANAGLNGIWKAILSDDSNSAVGRILMPGAVYNNRPASSGGYQLVAANSSTFWGSALGYSLQYNASGTSPGSTVAWTGSTAAGASNTGLTCSSWSTNSSLSSAENANNAGGGNEIATGTGTCNNYYSLYCTNQQTSSAAPPSPTGFTWSVSANNYITVNWASGGGTTATYQLAYQTGSAPANCTTGTIISPSTLGVNPTSYTVTGLSASTTYGFALCALNSDQSQTSSAVTFTEATQSSSSSAVSNLGSTQVVFTTAGTYNGSFGGLYYADFICQNEANAQSLGGVWKAVMGDDSTSAVSRIAIAGSVYNNRPVSSGGLQLIASNSSAFWGSSMAYTSNYNAAGTSPGSNVIWTGTTAAGALNTGLTCSSWTTNLATTNGEYGFSSNTNNAVANGNQTCNNTYSLYCTNQQTAAAAPPNPATFTWYTAGDTYMNLTFTSGGGTTAGFQLAYQVGTAPSNCKTGTVVTPTTLGLNPTSYSVTGLTASTTYGFRLCAVNSDQSQLSSGLTFTQATVASSSTPLTNLGTKQVIFETSGTYYANFGGLYYGDFICQNEAAAAGLSGTWKVVASDDSTAASSRLTIPGVVYNNRPSSSGGIQQVAANSSQFWGSLISYSIEYNASGTSPGSGAGWTGSTAAGAINTGLTCSSWTNNNGSASAEYGNNTGGGNVFANATTGCSNKISLYCLNQQTSASAPPDPATFSVYSTGSTSIGFSFSSGGGTTAGYELAYIAGSTPPAANCSSGTVISAATLGINPTTYVLSSLSASTTYSFRLCAINSDSTSISTGKTISAVTTGSSSTAPVVSYGSTQVIFNTNNNYSANFGGLYFGDFICNQEATNAGLPGTWRAILSDDSTSASSRITLSSNIYNNRPITSGGIQLLTNSTNFWAANFPYALRYNATGVTPSSNVPWTGSTSAGASKTGFTCSSWTTNSNASNGEYGVSSNTNSTSVFDNGNTPCNNGALNLYCINQQSSAAAPTAPTAFSAPSTGTSSVVLTWTNGGGTTAAFQIAYQTGASAPSTCSSGTVITAATLGINPSTYTVTGLTSGTQYTFLLCSANSDLSQFTKVASPVTVTTTTLTTPANQTVFATANTYRATMGGLYFADYICQTEAISGALAGTWKAVLSSDSTSAASRITLASNIYNNRPSGSGGPQSVATNSNFWSSVSNHAAGWNYNASGTAPGSNNTWTGSTTAGAIASGLTCTGWTSNLSTSNAEYGQNTQLSSATEFALGTTACSNSDSIYCIGAQTSSAAPPNPATFATYEVGSTTIGFLFTSGGGTTAAYQMSYQTGATAPANCSSTGTIVSASTLGLNPSSYTISGLSAGTQYSFRLCAENSDLTSASSGVTLTVTTQASGNPTSNTFGTNQFIFATSGTYYGNLGSLYFGDYVCETEASNAGLPGNWRAILSDGSTSASSHIALSGNIYNLRAMSAGGAQKVSDSTNFWNNLYYNSVTYTGTGSTATTNIVWTGTTATGANAANTCSGWTSEVASTLGEYGVSTQTGNAVANGTTNCNTNRTLYCINQQSSAAAPNEVASFNAYEIGTTSIGFLWASGGGTTAAYQLAYQAGTNAPANCNSGTVVAAATLGLNPTSYTVTGLTPNTNYSFRLCAENSDLSQASTGLTITQATNASTTSYNLGSTQFIFATSGNYNAAFGGIYFGDRICQTEAATDGLPGIWKAVLSDSSNAAASHISLTGNLYNFRPLSAGGAQKVSDSSAFWNNIFYNNAYYTGLGLTPTTTAVWTGSTNAGASATNTCTNWTSVSNTGTPAGESGRSNNTGAFIDNGNNTCNNTYTLYCVNQQTASSAPPDVSTFTSYALGSSSVGLIWTSGGGTTATYQLSYQTGSAPASCTSGTVVTPATLGLNPSTYVVTGLSASTTYYFRLCALNSDLSATSSGITYSVATTASGQSNPLNSGQFLFATSGTYTGAVGGIYFADSACQREATTAGLSGTWKAVISDSTNAISSRLNVTSNVYNFRPLSSGGAQKISDSVNFFNGTFFNTPNYTPVGLTPTTAGVWTGSTYAGAVTSNNCNNWTSLAAAAVGESGRSNSLGNTIDVGNNTCNSAFTFYCLNQQTSSATPPNVTGLTAVEATSTSVTLAWSSGGGTTGNYQIAYKSGSSAPSSCTAGTVIPALSISLNAGSYTITGLSTATQYSFLVCGANSDATAFSSGSAVTVTTTSSGSSYPFGSDQFIFATSGTYNGDLGSVYFGDYICQTEATNAGFSGTWKAVLSDNSNAASSHITVTGNLYNLRPSASGGPQKVSDANNFFNGTMYNAVNYTALGLTPSTSVVWTGSTALGAISGNSCSSWSTVASSVQGSFGRNNNAGATLNNGTSNCNNSYTLYCTNQQPSSAAPPNPATFSQYLLGPTSVGFTFSSGGGTTAAYQIAYQTGSSAPANCNAGTVISPATIGINPSAYTVTGLSPSTQYSFLLCAVNSDSTAMSSGISLTGITTEASGTPVSETLTGLQLVFATATTYQGFFGGIYYGDFICQQEATNNGLSGTWFAVIGDDSTAPSSHISLTGGSVFNTRPASSGGIQQISNGTGFWSGPYSNQANYAAAGGPPGNVRAWTGALNTGLSNVGTTCSSWSTAANTVNGEIAATTVPNNGASWTTAGCNNFYSLYCINQQTSSATPPDATSFSAYSTNSTSIGLVWTPGGGTTAAYQLAYQTGSSAPANCSSGTVVAAATLGVNPTTYTVTGLSANTTYSFLLCAENSDLTSASAGMSLTVTTPSAGTTYNLGTSQYIFSTAGSYYPDFGGIYFADYICSTEASAAGLPGTWGAVIGDATTTAASHVNLTGNIYNMRPLSSGGAQFASNANSFFSSDTLANEFIYSGAGGSPGNAYNWTGSNQAGTVNANTCSSWTTGASATNGVVGRNTTTVNYVGNTTTSCNSTRSLFCINQQLTPATPPNVTGFTDYILAPTYVGLSWTSGGGSTAAYQISYLTGSTPPASCSVGTVIAPSSMQVNASTYTVSGLSAGTQYAFLICAVNSNQSAMSSGVSLVVTTPSSGLQFYPGSDQFVFTTAANYSPNFGSTYFGDFICQKEAVAAGLNGTWKAIIGDDSNAATSRISLSSNIYNMRPATSGGSQLISNSSTFWTGALLFGMNYTASGGTPGNTRTWTGMGNSGALNTSHTCNSWTSNTASYNAAVATDTALTTNTYENIGNVNCNTTYSLYCINQQTPDATPPEVSGLAVGTTTASSVQLNWTAGTGDTAGYQISYQLGATAPADCNSGTVISAFTIGINPTTYTVTGLSANVQYSFRVCAENSDLSQPSVGMTETVTTP